MLAATTREGDLCASNREAARRLSTIPGVASAFTAANVTARAAARPQHLLLTLLGDYWLECSQALPSTALVRLLAEFGVRESNARAALSRLARKDLLVATRRGRRTAYALSGRGLLTLREGTDRIFGLGVAGRAWDGRWTLVTFSVPEESRSLRGVLRTRLRWLGFAPLVDAVWIAPGDLRVPASGVIEELGVPTSTIVFGEVWGQSASEVARAWRLDEVQERYRGFLARFAPVVRRVERGGLPPRLALTLRTALMDEWRTFPAMDPELPAELLPASWPAAAARELFEGLYDALAGEAAQAFRELVAVDDPEAAGLARAHSSTGVLHARHDR